MKILTFSLLTILSFETFAKDLATKHAAFCDNAAVKEVMGENDSCRVVIATSPAEKGQGNCIGLFRGSLPCMAAFVTIEEGSAIQLICGTDPQNPVIDQMIRATGMNYNVAAVVSKADGSEIIVNDSAAYSIYDSSLVGIALNRSETKVEGTVTLQLRTGPADLTDVKCE